MGRFYAGRMLSCEYSPVTDFREARCRQFDEGTWYVRDCSAIAVDRLLLIQQSLSYYYVITLDYYNTIASFVLFDSMGFLQCHTC